MISLIGLAALFLGLWLFFLPSILAKGKPQEDKVTLVNVFWGATGVGWLWCLIWALYQRKQLPFPISSYIEKIEKKLMVWGKWFCILAGFIFLLIWDFKTHRGHKTFFDFSVFSRAGASFWDIVALKWLPMCMQFLLLMVLADRVVGLKSMGNRSAVLLTGSVTLILFSLNYIKPGALEYFVVLWGSFFLYTFSIKE